MDTLINSIDFDDRFTMEIRHREGSADFLRLRIVFDDGETKEASFQLDGNYFLEKFTPAIRRSIAKLQGRSVTDSRSVCARQ